MTLRRTRCFTVLVSAGLALPFLAWAQSNTSPGAGNFLQQVPPPSVPPADSGKHTDLALPTPPLSDLPDSVPITVSAIRFTGNQAFSSAALEALVADSVGKALTLKQIGALANRVAAHYHVNGFPLARAVVPAQELDAHAAGNSVLIQVVEARFGQVTLDNQSSVNTALLQSTLADLTSGSDVQQAPLDRAMLLLRDVPNLAVTATLKSGEAVGTSDLQVMLRPAGKAITTSALVDNYGSRYIGRTRLSAHLNWANPLDHGDLLSLTALTGGPHMAYARAGYDSLVHGSGTHAGAALSAMTYALGAPLSALNAHGTAQTASGWVRQPLRRGQSSNVYAQLQLDYLKLRDQVDVSNTRTYRHLGFGTLSVSGTEQSTGNAVGASYTQWNAALSTGRVGFDDPQALAADATSAQTQGRFAKLNAGLSHLQELGEPSAQTSVYAAAASQWSTTNLDASQKMGVGGQSSVRAYDVGALSGDEGLRLTLELRRNLGEWEGGMLQTVAFVDTAQIRINKSPWTGVTDPAQERLSGAGLGLNWAGSSGMTFRLAVAKPIGPVPQRLGTERPVRGWLEMGGVF